MTATSNRPYKGVFPVVPTTFNDAGELDLPSQLRCVDFMIEAGSGGLCILANFSEQFLLSDDEREVLTGTCPGSAGGARAWPPGCAPAAGASPVRDLTAIEMQSPSRPANPLACPI